MPFVNRRALPALFAASLTAACKVLYDIMIILGTANVLHWANTMRYHIAHLESSLLWSKTI